MDNRIIKDEGIDFLIFCTQTEVLNSLLHSLGEHEKHVDEEGGIDYFTSEIKSKGNLSTRLVVIRTGMGNTNAAITAAKAIRKWNPRNVFLVGVAASVDVGVKFGDILIGNQVIGPTHEGNYVVHDLVKTSPRLIHNAKEYYETWISKTDFDSLLNPLTSQPKSKILQHPTIHVGSLMSADRGPTTKDALLYQDGSKILGVEMEGLGIGQVIQESRVFNPSYLILRSVSDDASAKKGLHENSIAAKIASSYAIGLIKTLAPRSFNSLQHLKISNELIPNDIELEIRLDTELGKFPEEDLTRILQAIKGVLELGNGDIQITGSTRG